MELRKHQEECIESIEENFLENKKGLIKMFCGSGKSLIIYHSLLKYCEKLSVLVVPSINLITQFNNDYMLNVLVNDFNKKYFNKKFDLMSICSKDELEKPDGNSNLITTDKYEINKFINKNNQKVLLVTYQSLPNLIEIIKDNNILIDIICFDEAHHILGENISKLLLSKSNNFIDNFVDKTLFFTATPKNTKDYKMYDNLTEITIDNIEHNIIDNINEDNYNKSMCGPLVYEYSHLDGVTDDILNDFNIRVELYSENTKSTIFETISRAILETGNNRVLTFHSRSLKKSDKSSDVVSFSSKENIVLFKNSFYKILNSDFPHLSDKYKKINLKGITSQTKNKTSILTEFDNTKDNEIFILASCKTIGEGVDTKNANMACFIDPKQSYTEIIQNIGRICRKNKTTNKISTVLIPSYINIENYNICHTSDEIDNIIRSEMSNNSDYNGILSVLSALRQEDPYMFELCLKYPNTYTNNEFKRQFKRFNLILDDTEYNIEELFNQYEMTYDSTISSTDNFKNLSENLNKNIKIFCKNIDEKNIRINKKYEFDECFVKTENEGYIKVLGKKERDTKVTRPNRNIKPFVHADSKIKVLWDIDKINTSNEIDFSKKIFGCFIKSTVVANTKQLWLEMYNNIMNDTLENMLKYSSWISRNKQHYKNNAGLFKDQDIKNLWETIKNDEIKGSKFYSKEEIWFMKLEDYKNYYLTPEYEIDKENNSFFMPTKSQHMYDWINRNVKNYRNNKSLMVNLEIKQEWESFMYDSKYYDLFKHHNYTSQYNIDKWKKYLNLVINSSKILKKTNLVGKNYLDSNLTDEEKNSFWLINSKNNWIEQNNRLFESKKEIMESEEIYKLWDNFLLKNKKIIIKIKKENEEKIADNETKYLHELDDFKKKLDSIEERTITTFSPLEMVHMNRKNITVSVNEPNFKFSIDNWLKLINDDNYKKFALTPRDNFYFYLNYFKKIFDEKTILTEEIRKIFCCWYLECCQRNYKKNFSEMSLENKDIRKDYRDFKSQYNL
jgi:superfamily II DNA or RNA helicase